MNPGRISQGPVYEKALTIAAERVAEAVKQGYDAHLLLVMVGIGSDEAHRIDSDRAIDRALELGLLVKASSGKYAVAPDSKPPSLTDYIDKSRLAVYDGKQWKPVVETDIPFGDDEPQRTPPEAEPLEFAGMKCKNASSAAHQGYWFFVGLEDDARNALAELLAVGIDAGIKQHGTKRHKEHVGEPPLWTLIFPYEANQGMLDAALSRLSLIDFDGAASVWSGDISDCRLVAKSYANRGRECKVSLRDGETTVTITE